MQEFNAQLNSNVQKTLENGDSFLLNTDKPVNQIFNSFSGKPYGAENFIHLKTINDLAGTGFNEYVSQYKTVSEKADWITPLKEKPMAALVKSESYPVDNKLEFVIPVAPLNQNVIKDDNTHVSRKNYVPYQTKEYSINDFNNFAVEHITNVLNASMTDGTIKPFATEKEKEQFRTNMLVSMSKDPDYFKNIVGEAQNNLTNYHYIPFDKSEFIAKARDENSGEFRKLNTAIQEHVADIHTTGGQSFNKEFTELAQPLFEQNKNLDIAKDSDKKTLEQNTESFVKDNIKKDKPASTLADTFMGTLIEKAKKLSKVGKTLAAAAIIASASLTALAPQAQASGSRFTVTPAVEMNAAVSDGQFNFHDYTRVNIGSKSYQGQDLNRLLNFDNTPFDITGDRNVKAQDYMLAYEAQSHLSNYSQMTPSELHAKMLRAQDNKFQEKVNEILQQKHGGYEFGAQDYAYVLENVSNTIARRDPNHRNIVNQMENVRDNKIPLGVYNRMVLSSVNITLDRSRDSNHLENAVEQHIRQLHTANIDQTQTQNATRIARR